MSAKFGHASRMAHLRLASLVKAQNKTGSDGDASKFENETVEFANALGVLSDGVAFVLATAQHERSFGPALIWAMQNKANALRLFSDQRAGDLARIARYFQFDSKVFEVDASNVARVAEPIAVDYRETSAADEMFVNFIRSAGADVVREHGVITGEVFGLEVCRVVHDASPSTGTELAEAGRLEIGVGAHDRETFKLLHGQTATVEALRDVVSDVAARRVVGAQTHPLNQLARERLLRHIVCQSPQLVGAKSLQFAQPPLERKGLKESVPCCAVGESLGGEKIVVVFSIGVDPDVVSFGADARGQLNRSAELVLVMPSRDILPVVERVAQLLERPARFVGVDVLNESNRA